MTSVAREIADFQDAGSLVDEAAAQRMGINRTDRCCLGLLAMHGAMSAGQLAIDADLSPGAMTVAIDRLERLGYVRRVRSSTDRRSVLVEIMPTAQQIIEENYKPIGLERMAQLEQYNNEELAFLRDFLHKGREMQMRHAARIRASANVSPLSEGD